MSKISYIISTYTTKYLPHDYEGLKIVESMSGIITAEFNKHLEYDVLALPRTLTGDYNGLATSISNYISLNTNDSEDFTLETFTELMLDLEIPLDQIVASHQIKADLFHSKKYNPYLFIEGKYFGQNEGFSNWHYDDANVEDNMTTRILCSYNRPATEFLRLSDAISTGGHLYKQKPNTKHWSAQPQDITRHRLYVENEQETNNATVHRRPDTTNTSIPGLLLNA